MLLRWHSKCQIGSTSDSSLLTFSIVEGVWACIPVEKDKKYICFFFSHPQNRSKQKPAHLSSVRTSVCTSDLIPLLLTCINIKLHWSAIQQGVFKTEIWTNKTHFHNDNFNLHIRWQIQFRLERSHHGNQQMNSGQKVFVVDDWQANSREQNTHTHKIKKQQLALIWQNSPPPSVAAKKGQKTLNLINKQTPSWNLITTENFKLFSLRFW